MRKETFLQREPTEQSNRVKYQHLQSENTHLAQTILELQSLIASLRTLNSELQSKSPGAVQILIGELTSQNRTLEQSVFRLLRSNQQLSCSVLMKDQLLCETQREHREVVESYEEKVYELRISLQSKETAVSAMEDKMNQLKEETYDPASRVNLLYYNEINELKAIHDRLALENSQLTFLNAVKDEEIERMKGVMEGIERAMEKKEEWRKCKEAILGDATQMNAVNKGRKVEARSKLEEELTRYDSKYKTLNSIKALTSSQVSSLKFLITHLHKQNRDIHLQKQKVQNALSIKDKQYRMLQEAYQRIKTELIIDRIEVQFYRDNFKELSKVPAERRIKFYQEYYEESLPNLEKRLKEKQQVIAYWKHWAQLTKDTNGKCIINRDTKPINPNKRSHSCSARFCYIVESPRKKPIATREKEEAIFSFINETHNVDSMMNYTVDAQNQLLEAPQAFNDDISVIIRPKVVDSREKSRKKIEE